MALQYAVVPEGKARALHSGGQGVFQTLKMRSCGVATVWHMGQEMLKVMEAISVPSATILSARHTLQQMHLIRDGNLSSSTARCNIMLSNLTNSRSDFISSDKVDYIYPNCCCRTVICTWSCGTRTCGCQGTQIQWTTGLNPLTR